MIQSMTGFGKASKIIGTRKVTVEIKSVNSKQLDLNLKIPSLFREKEMEMRSLLSKNIERGKAECLVHFEMLDPESNVNLNTDMVKNYLDVLIPIAKDKGIFEHSDLMSSVLRFPEVSKSPREELTKEDGQNLLALVEDAVKEFQSFRLSEGAKLNADFELRISNLRDLLGKVIPLSKERVPEKRSRLEKALEEQVGKDKIDENRFEQELIYYLEKLDVTEEEIRLNAHLDYFMETLNNEGPVGKKLGFISQEIGREVNTLGSKANNSEIQQLVVRMKDELEKIKEQVLNIC